MRSMVEGALRAPKRTRDFARRLRREMTLPEVVLWRHLRGKSFAHLRFRRQHPVGPYVLDFYCAELRLAVEVEGQVHNIPDRAVHDETRVVWLAQQGIRVLRIAAADILKDDRLEWALMAIVSTPSTALGGPPPP